MKTLTIKGMIPSALVQAAAANLDSDNPKYSLLVTNNALNPLVPIVNFPIKRGAVKRITYVASAAEVRQQTLIAAEIPSVITASTKYSITIDHVDSKINSERRGTATVYSYTSPAVLSGNVDTDRANVYTALVNKINAYAANHVEAILVSRMPYTTGAVSAPVVGDVITETAGAETATVVGHTITSGTFAGGNAAGMIYVHTPSAAFEGGASTLTSGSTLTTTATFTDGQAILLIDDAGYYVTPSESRAGASLVSLTSGFRIAGGVTIASANIIVNRVYSQGIGTEMLLHTPLYSNPKMDVLSGDIEYTFNTPPVAGETYTMAVIDIEHSPETDAGFGSAPVQQVQLQVYISEANAQNLAALQVALNALVGL